MAEHGWRTTRSSLQESRLPAGRDCGGEIRATTESDGGEHARASTVTPAAM